MSNMKRVVEEVVAEEAPAEEIIEDGGKMTKRIIRSHETND